GPFWQRIWLPLPEPMAEQSQEKCAAILRPELRKNKYLEHGRDSKFEEKRKCSRAPQGRLDMFGTAATIRQQLLVHAFMQTGLRATTVTKGRC
ncbi:hypothetical protein AB4144_48910, partial [Rhizobiaceae sp. 2RAB30]